MEVILKRVGDESKVCKITKVDEVTKESICLDDMTLEELSKQIRSLMSLFSPSEEFSNNPWTVETSLGVESGNVLSSITIDPKVLYIYLVRKER